MAMSGDVWYSRGNQDTINQEARRTQSTAINSLSGASGGHILDHKVGGQLKGRCGIPALRRERLI